MRNTIFPVTCFAFSVLVVLSAGKSVAMPQANPPHSEALMPVIAAKLKCGFNESGKFICKNVNKKNSSSHQNDSGSSGQSNKCAGKNDCGSGYRDLDQPNRYGACCEEIKETEEPKKTNEPTTGQCLQVEKMSEMNCKAPFDALSCGALENGVMRCCCVK